MEVHHHSHPPEAHKRGSKWIHYLWEFVMLFLAVFCGFLAENQREHYVEHQREKQFIRSLYNDVKMDTANLSRIIQARTSKDELMDSLLYMMNSDSINYFTARIYLLGVPISRTLQYRFVPNDGTMQQLKNSGSLRLIRKQAVVDSISKYDIQVRSLIGQWGVEESLIDHYRTAAAKIFDGSIFDKMLDADNNIVGMPPGKLALQPYAKSDLYEWNYRMFSIKSLNKANRRDAKQLLAEAVNLLKTLEINYNLN